MLKYATIFITILAVIVVTTSCSDDDPVVIDPCAEINYESTVKEIINSSCAYSGCHDGTGANTFIPELSNDFTTYAGLKSVLDGGTFNTNTIVNKTMPPAAFVQPGFPMELTDDQIETLTCWHDAGYPEN